MNEEERSKLFTDINVQGVCETITNSELVEHGLEVVNIVATMEMGREFDLGHLSANLSNSEYDPERSPFLLYRPEGNSTLLIPSNGLISIVGARSTIDVESGIRDFLLQLVSLEVEVTSRIGEVVIQNIVFSGDLELELNLNTLAVGIGLERCEYEPEQFPGLIFRTRRGGTVLLFRTGSYLIMGVTSYDSGLQELFELSTELESVGIEFHPQLNNRSG